MKNRPRLRSPNLYSRITPPMLNEARKPRFLDWSKTEQRVAPSQDREATNFATDVLDGSQVPEDIFFRGEFMRLPPDKNSSGPVPAWSGEVNWKSSVVSLAGPPNLLIAQKSRIGLFTNPNRLAFAQPALMGNDDGTQQVSWIFVAYLPAEELDEVLAVEGDGIFFSGWLDTASRLETSGFNSTWFYCTPLVQTLKYLLP